jgi:hypothetical protein
MTRPHHDGIRFWFKRNDREFAEQAEREREQDQQLIESGMPAKVAQAFARMDQERHERDQFPVGAFFESIDSSKHHGRKASTAMLLTVAEVGEDLLYSAIATADEEDQFPVGAFLDTIKEDYDGDWRPSSAQLMRVAETGMELFYAAIGHIDATKEFLEEARSQWGPLVDAALDEMHESIERRDPVTGEVN